MEIIFLPQTVSLCANDACKPLRGKGGLQGK